MPWITNKKWQFIEDQIVAIHIRLNHIEVRLKQMAMSMQDVVDRVEQENTVIDSVVLLLQDLSQRLKNARQNSDPSVLQSVIDAMDAHRQKLAEAVVANTPADEQATEEPSPPDQPPPSNVA